MRFSPQSHHSSKASRTSTGPWKASWLSSSSHVCSTAPPGRRSCPILRRRVHSTGTEPERTRVAARCPTASVRYRLAADAAGHRATARRAAGSSITFALGACRWPLRRASVISLKHREGRGSSSKTRPPSRTLLDRRTRLCSPTATHAACRVVAPPAKVPSGVSHPIPSCSCPLR